MPTDDLRHQGLRWLAVAFAMGLGAAVPGWSAAAVALAMGAYLPLVMAMQRLLPISNAAMQMLRPGMVHGVLHVPPHLRPDLRPHLTLSLIGGMVIAASIGYALCSAWLLPWWSAHEVLAKACAFGALLAAIPRVGVRLRWSRAAAWSALLGVVLGLAAQRLEPLAAMEHGWSRLLGSAGGAATWFVPGLPHPEWLLWMGLSDSNGAQWLAVAVGALLGCFVLVHALAWLMVRGGDELIALLLGLMSTGLLRLWPWQQVLSYTAADFDQRVALSLKPLWPAEFATLMGVHAAVWAAIAAGTCGFLANWLLLRALSVDRWPLRDAVPTPPDRR